MKNAIHWRGVTARTLALVLGLLVTGAITAQTPAPDAKPAATPAAKGAKATKPAKKALPPEFKMVLEPRAMELLKATSAKLAAAKSMSFTATVGYEYPSKLGPPIVYTMRYEVTMQRPDKLKVTVPGDGPASEFYYDGKQMMAYRAGRKSGGGCGRAADDRRGVDGGVREGRNLLSIRGSGRCRSLHALTDGAILAFYIGPSGIVGGTKTDMMAWANDNVFLQIWIGVDDKLPRRIRAVYRRDPFALRHEMELIELAARRCDRAGRVRVAEGAIGEAHRVREPGRRAAARREAAGQGEAAARARQGPKAQ